MRVKEFCVITESVRRGIPVSVSVKHAEELPGVEPAVASVGEPAMVSASD